MESRSEQWQWKAFVCFLHCMYQPVCLHTLTAPASLRPTEPPAGKKGDREEPTVGFTQIRDISLYDSCCREKLCIVYRHRIFSQRFVERMCIYACTMLFYLTFNIDFTVTVNDIMFPRSFLYIIISHGEFVSK